jgi:hypothetical protein
MRGGGREEGCVNDQPKSAPAPADEPPARRPYEKPCVTWEDHLGGRPGLVAACNKTAPLVGTCDTGSLQS